MEAVSTNHKLQFHVYPYSKIPALYESIYNDLFGPMPLSHLPATILIGEVGHKIIGMIAVYVVDRNTLHIQSAGFLHEHRNSRQSLQWLSRAISHLHTSAEFIMAEIYNTNPKALRMALKAGFVIKGTRLDMEDKLLVKLAHRRGQ